MPDDFDDEEDAWVSLGEAVEIVMDDLQDKLMEMDSE
jgi:hypothetical protein